MSIAEANALHDLIREAEAAVKDPWRRDPWLRHMTATQAFVVCVGAGPWRITRRRKIQTEALEQVGDMDLSDCDSVPSYPLVWQNSMVQHLHDYLKVRTTMTAFCAGLQDPRDLYAAAGCPKGTKVLSLFARDYLELPAFPIDRHVRRLLQAHQLPCREDVLIALCRYLGFHPSDVAQLLVRYGSRDDTMNPQDLVPAGSSQAMKVMHEIVVDRLKAARATLVNSWGHDLDGNDPA